MLVNSIVPLVNIADVPSYTNLHVTYQKIIVNLSNAINYC